MITQTLYQYLVHFCQIKIGKQVTFWTNVKQSTIEYDTSVIKYSQTPPTQNSSKVRGVFFVKNKSLLLLLIATLLLQKKITHK